MTSKEVYLNKTHYNGKVLTGETMYYNQNTGYGTAKGKCLFRMTQKRTIYQRRLWRNL
ncbi:hypothetical protein INT81_07890 [Riemerella anatipestifer]|nr:hypothetical protein [Riemerella anatipestifer]